MLVENLKIQDFRNITNAQYSFHKNINFITGLNGSGKTNILEAISLLSIAKSFRVSSDKPLVQFTKSTFYLAADTVTHQGKIKVELAYNGKNKKTKVNHSQMKRLVDFVGTIRTVSFAPNNLSLIQGSKSERRSFLDTMLSQISNKYCLDLTSYLKIVEQRNRIIKDKPHQAQALLQAWNTQLGMYAVEVWFARYEAIKKIDELSREFFKDVADTEDDIAISYYPEIGEEFFEINENTSKEELLLKYLETLEQNQQWEFRRGYTLFGPHRDDFVVKINEMDSKIFASQGQQRLMALSLKLAELHFIEETTDESPILLLDDIFSELDKEKVKGLLKLLSKEDRQIFITTTDRTIELPENSQAWVMKDGILRKDLP